MQASCFFFLLWWSVYVVRAREECVYHLHQPKCGGTFVWRLLRNRFCVDENEICTRNSLRPPPSCKCVVNPITKESKIQAALRAGTYRFISAHSLAQFSSRCHLAVWFREPNARVISHWGYFRYRRGFNLTSLATLLENKPPRWANNQQWSLFMQASVKGSPTQNDVNAATTKLSTTAFVGILNDMDASLCLFASTFLSSTQTLDLCGTNRKHERQNMALRKSPKRDQRLETLLTKHNKFDATLFDLATAEFKKRASNFLPAAALLRSSAVSV